MVKSGKLVWGSTNCTRNQSSAGLSLLEVDMQVGL